MRSLTLVLCLVASAALVPAASADGTCADVLGIALACAGPEDGLVAIAAIDAAPFACVPEGPCPAIEANARLLVLNGTYFFEFDAEACAKGLHVPDVGTCSLVSPA